MLPTLSIPALGLTLRSYDTLYLITALFVLAVGPPWVARLADVNVRRVRRATVIVVFAAIVGARLQFVIMHWPAFAARPMVALKLWGAGRHVAGGVLAVLLVAPFVARFYGLPALRSLDGAMPTMGVAIAISRIGCFLHGCCAGVRCDWPWCVRFPRWTWIYESQVDAGLIPIGASASLPVHSLQLYFALAGLFAAGLAYLVYPRRRYDGEVALLVVTFLFAASWALEGFRATGLEGATVARGLRSLALVGAVVSAVAVVLSEAVYRWRRRQAPPICESRGPA